jgi:hypothetical protein
LLLPERSFAPAGLRAGGSIQLFDLHNDIELLLWRMRLRSRDTLAHYLQESRASTTLTDLSHSAKSRIVALSSITEILLAHAPL